MSLYRTCLWGLCPALKKKPLFYKACEISRDLDNLANSYCAKYFNWQLKGLAVHLEPLVLFSRRFRQRDMISQSLEGIVWAAALSFQLGRTQHNPNLDWKVARKASILVLASEKITCKRRGGSKTQDRSDPSQHAHVQSSHIAVLRLDGCATLQVLPDKPSTRFTRQELPLWGTL